MSFFQFSSPIFSIVNEPMFKGVTNKWNMEVPQVVMKFADLFMGDNVLLANFMLAQITLCRSNKVYFTILAHMNCNNLFLRRFQMSKSLLPTTNNRRWHEVAPTIA